MNRFVLQRLQRVGPATLGSLSLGGLELCRTLEDTRNDVKIPGKTRIPAGTYPLKLRTVGGFHESYAARYGGAWHKGMVWLQDIPNFEYVLLHIGNTVEDTKGCILVGMRHAGQTLLSSRIAYEAVYPLVRDAILKGGAELAVIDERE